MDERSTRGNSRPTPYGAHQGSKASGVVRHSAVKGGVSSRTAQMTRRASAHAGGSHSRGGHALPRRRRGALPLALGSLAVVALLAVAAIALAPRLLPPSGSGTEPVPAGRQVTVNIPEGSGASAVAQILQDAGIIGDQTAFLKEVQAQGAESSMKSGTYDLITGGNVRELVRTLVSGPNSSSSRVTVAEGLTLTRTAAVVQDALGISSEEFLAQAKASNYAGDYPFLADAQDDSLEGFLYPSTYDLGGGEVTADTVIRAMLDQYRANVLSLDLGSAKASIQDRYGVSMSDYDILKLASIIEKEALNDDDRYKIASVMYNRMKADMALQSDATMGYVTGAAVTADDLKTDSPYNTYLHKGLTPTPICAPSLASVQAALNPADTGYYYFWITDSEHIFSESYEDHQSAIANSTGA